MVKTELAGDRPFATEIGYLDSGYRTQRIEELDCCARRGRFDEHAATGRKTQKAYGDHRQHLEAATALTGFKGLGQHAIRNVVMRLIGPRGGQQYIEIRRHGPQRRAGNDSTADLRLTPGHPRHGARRLPLGDFSDDRVAGAGGAAVLLQSAP